MMTRSRNTDVIAGLTRRGMGRKHFGGVLMALMALGACADGTGLEGLDDQLVLDVALLAADATVEEFTLWSQPTGFDGAGPALVGGSGAFATPGVPGRGGFAGEGSGTRSVTFFDVTGAEQGAYDELTTASIHILHDVSGTISRDNFVAEISRERDMTVSGMEDEETTRTWNGSGSSEMSRTGVQQDGTERSHSASGTSVFQDVVVPIPGSASPYPISGTITRSMVGSRTTAQGTQTREIEVIITFDGTSIATAVVNGENVEIDLAARPGINPLRRR
jgi:hypothetical protein